MQRLRVVGAAALAGLAAFAVGAYACYDAAISYGPVVNPGKAWTDCDGSPGRYRVWARPDGECGAEVELWRTIYDDDVSQPYVCVDQWYEKTYVWDSECECHSTSDYGFRCDVQVRAYSHAGLDAAPEGCGQAVSGAKAKVRADDATASPDEDQVACWTGARVIEGQGGCSGVGAGLTPASTGWSSPRERNRAPSRTMSVNADAGVLNDDPGSHAFGMVWTAAAAEAEMNGGNGAHCLAIAGPPDPFELTVVAFGRTTPRPRRSSSTRRGTPVGPQAAGPVLGVLCGGPEAPAAGAVPVRTRPTDRRQARLPDRGAGLTAALVGAVLFLAAAVRRVPARRGSVRQAASGLQRRRRARVPLIPWVRGRLAAVLRHV